MLRFAACALISASVASMCHAETPTTPSNPRFDILRYAVDGVTLLSPSKIEAALQPLTGRQQDFGTVQKAMMALEKAYAAAGFTAIQVSLPEQELRDGEVRLQVRELRLGQLSIEGNRFFDESNVRASLPALKPGAAPNVDAVARNLRTANENPSKGTTVILSSGRTDGTVDATARIVDQQSWRAALTVDSTGTPSTGILRTGVSAQHANLFNRDHVISGQYITSPAYPNRVSIVGLGYHVPLYSAGDSVDYAYVFSDVDSGQVSTAGGNFAISGGGHFHALRYNLNLPRSGNWDRKFQFGLDWREYTNSVRFNGAPGSQVPDQTVHPWSIGYSARYRTRQDDLSLFLSVYRNVPGGPDGDAAAFNRSRQGADSVYTIWRFAGAYLRTLPKDWQVRTSVSGQYTSDLLVAGEQFGIGGMDSVRGFLEREVANDRGVRAGLELYSPDLGLGLEHGFRTRVLGFADYGYVARNRPLPGEVTAETISSYGLGMRSSYRDLLNVRLDVGQVHQGGGTQRQGDTRLQGVVSLVF
ncbi:MAG: ShlB/FhaC/HecB family hemolysin secretion/activation protein [Betaproteobacteria bacterium]